MPTLISSKTGLSKEERTHIHVGANKNNCCYLYLLLSYSVANMSLLQDIIIVFVFDVV